MRILITGSGGLLGGRLCEILAEAHEVIGLVRSRPAPPGITGLGADLRDAAATDARVREARPDLIVHCAALADVEACERDPLLAERENVDVTRSIAAAARATGARLVAISTDLVFDGRSAFSDESTAPQPLMVYGRSKLEAESAALDEAGAPAVVLRVALICGRGAGARKSASEGIASRLLAGESVTLYEDEWRTPIDPDSIGDAVRAVIAHPEAAGIFHIAGAERVNRYELGLRTARVLGLPADLVRRASQASHRGAPRPADVSLDITRARTALRWTPRPLDAALGATRTD